MDKTKKIRNSPELIARIATQMKEKRHNAPSLASALGMSRQWGYEIMKNHIRLSADMLAKIAQILGVTTDSLHSADSGGNGKIDLRKYVTEICDERIEERIKDLNKTE